MKKIISVALTVLMLFNIGISSVQAVEPDATAEISQVSALPGDKVEVYINFVCAGGIKTLSFLDFTFDDTILTIVESECTWLADGKIKDIDFDNNASIITFEDNIVFDGDILKLVFKVSEDAALGSLPISCDVIGTKMIDKVETEIDISITGGGITVADSTAQLGDFEYELNANGIVITSYIGNKTTVVIGESYEIDGITYNVVEIAIEAFLGQVDITSVTIPETVEKIGEAAFYDCTSLTDVTILSRDTVIDAVALGYYYASRREHIVEGFTIYGYEGSTAEDYANTEDEITFIALEEDDEECSHDGGTANCQEQAVCDLCGECYGDIDKANHKTVVIDDAVESSCCEDGLTEGSHCDACGDIIVAQVTVPATGNHTYGTEWKANGNGTHSFKCTTTGCTVYGNTTNCSGGNSSCTEEAVCSTCGSEYGNLDEHVFDNEIVDEKYLVEGASCTAKAIYYKSCNCGLAGEETFEYGEMLEHTYSEIWTADEEAGKHYKLCAVCGEEGKITESCSGGVANCVDKAICTVCDTAYGNVDSTKHKTVVTDEAVTSSCYKDGLTEGSHCDACGETVVAQEVDPATGNHTYGTESKANNNGTHSFKCTTVGCTAYGNTTDCSGGNATCKEKAECSVCGKEYGDFGSHIDTADDNGYCDVCDELICKHIGTSGTPVEENKTESTCKIAGSYDLVVYCSVCDEELSRETITLPLADHTESETVEENRTESTCKVAGNYDSVIYCSICGDELSRDTISLPLATHTEETVKGYAATCTETGLTDGVKCSVCGETLTEQKEITVADHVDADSDYICDYGCGHEFAKPADPDQPDTPDEPEDPSENCDHLCHKTGFLGFLWKIVNFFCKLFKINPVCECGAAHY